METLQTDEKRRSTRHWRSQPVWWKDEPGRRIGQGWLLECSARGAAFLCRGRGTPFPGTRINVAAEGPRDDEYDMHLALAKRVRHFHSDVYLVAVEIANSQGGESPMKFHRQPPLAIASAPSSSKRPPARPSAQPSRTHSASTAPWRSKSNSCRAVTGP
jgi:hypothetical protein